MNKLREKIANVYIYIDKHPTLINCTLEDAGDIDTITSLEQITDDFTVAFYEWRSTSFMKNIDQYTTKELLEHFKNNVYGK
jgi:hypothetical protein